ncbi:hypothetical protein AB0E96_05465 [Kitasatospora sp. NPDC036755]|uniref:hypothetical protein n=1 Tax=Kitasatospora sp. NPDC036755 TaxID=3154600 RepID=UPI0033C60840
MIKMRTLAAAAVAAASLALGAAATPASATTATADCSSWNDNNTTGVHCADYTGATSFRAVATCNNGVRVYGPWQPVGKGVWSYAYCTSVGSSLMLGGYQTA